MTSKAQRGYTETRFRALVGVLSHSFYPGYARPVSLSREHCEPEGRFRMRKCTHPAWWVGEPANLRGLSCGIQQHLCADIMGHTVQSLQLIRLLPLHPMENQILSLLNPLTLLEETQDL